MSITTEIAQDKSDAVREQATKTAAGMADRARALYADATAWAGPQLRRSQSVATGAATGTVAFVQQNPIKTAVVGALFAAAGVAIGLLATRPTS